VIADLELRLQNALQPVVTPLEKRTAVQQFAMLGTIDLPPPWWARNVYGLAFGTGRQDQLKLDGKELAKAIQAVTDEDLQRLAEEVFAPAKRCIAIVEVE
jgi:hypothetical protein